MSPDLLFLCAERFEMEGFLDLFPAVSETRTPSGHKIISGRMLEKSYQLLVTGPGVFNAAAVTAAWLGSGAAPGMVINTGIAGGFELSGIRIGDAAIATTETYLHAGVVRDGDGILPAALPFELIKGLPETRNGSYPFPGPEIQVCIDRFLAAEKDQTKSFHRFAGPFVTVSTITASFAHAAAVHQACQPVMEAMEGAAAAHCALIFKVPMVEIRTCSNMTGERDKANWNIPLAVKHLGNALSFLAAD